MNTSETQYSPSAFGVRFFLMKLHGTCRTEDLVHRIDRFAIRATNDLKTWDELPVSQRQIEDTSSTCSSIIFLKGSHWRMPALRVASFAEPQNN
ncbi:MAG: hypothetical protein VXY07_15465 [Planctomycetota bacterium]|nr:hypothetical protein [Planctomycetota bacterium]MEC8784230.1 hypothetical protein [Planctomycetota bacterium]